MATVEAHYERVLSDKYSWMFGGFEAGIEKNRRFFAQRGIRPAGSGLAVDLGAGCGFQSIPLAEAGFSVVAVDIDRKLLAELEANAGDLPVRPVRDDLLCFEDHVEERVELVVCMTDTVLHLASRQQIVSLFDKVFAALHPGGRFILSFRDLSSELRDLDRFIPVRSDENVVFTCFLEYEPETVKVHDLVYERIGDQWSLAKSYYRKLRVSRHWVETALSRAGFALAESSVEAGMVTIIAAR